MKRVFKSPTGTEDFLPADHDYFTFVKKIIRHRFRQSGFRRISPPVFEESALFEKSLGVTSEIVDKEMYSFDDKHGRTFALRPEVTTGVVRAFIEHEMEEGALPVELYYIEPCFRFERPKSRTKREFYQFGSEVLGESDPAIDAQIMYLGFQILRDLGIWDFIELKVNTIGTKEDRKRYFEALADYFTGKERALSPGKREKFEQGKFLELLNPTTDDEEILVKLAPKMVDFLSPSSREFFDQMQAYLNSFGIEYSIDPSLIRPVEYYSHTTFEFREKGTRKKVLAGGRYDGLVKRMGGNDHGGCGFAGGVERVISLMREKGIDVPHKDYIDIFVAATGPVAKKHALPMLIKLREHGYHAVGVLGRTSMEEQLKRAMKFNVPYTVLMGDQEVKEAKVLVRDMKRGKSERINAKDLLPHMDKLLGEIRQDKMSDALPTPATKPL